MNALNKLEINTAVPFLSTGKKSVKIIKIIYLLPGAQWFYLGFFTLNSRRWAVSNVLRQLSGYKCQQNRLSQAYNRPSAGRANSKGNAGLTVLVAKLSAGH